MGLGERHPSLKQATRDAANAAPTREHWRAQSERREQAGSSGEGELQVAQKPRIGGAENAAATSAFATFEFATVSADQTPNAVAATIAKPMIPSLRIGLPLRPV